jgi:phosphoglycerate dehydrogenase-like enzyme
VGDAVMRAVFHHPCDAWLRERIATFAGEGVSIEIVEEAAGGPVDRALEGADVLLHVLHPVTREMMGRATGLKLIQKIGVGLDAIDLDAARDRGIAVCNMPGTNSQAVAELALGLMLAVLRGIPKMDHRLRCEGRWDLPGGAQGSFGEIGGKVIGLVGYGEVARRLEPVLHALGAREILICTRGDATPAVGRRVSKSELLDRADILSLHLPGTEESRHWLDATAISAMKAGAVVVNTSRGTVIDENALADALHSGRLGGAGLDVYAEEPPSPGAAILSAPNVVALPHIAWLTRDTLDRSLAVASENIARLSAGKPLLHRCD